MNVQESVFGSCEKHSEPLKYYCLGCDASCCADCIVFKGEHKDHDIKLADEIKQEYSKRVSQCKSKLASLNLTLTKNCASLMAPKKKKVLLPFNSLLTSSDYSTG